ncbi:Tetratricopeptide repeat protein 30A [Perkinsus chesapeaki]|uniref:Tetratricopeptide repeat protein 30A n=1 Tax=Perkinsus chesapeaki TaxID=330153 RepID=A0A7J6LG89_PERCH|nr:Tetratricopeptide repeat protein 30A [Perkinsus chesapeaki]
MVVTPLLCSMLLSRDSTSAWWAKYPNPDQPHVKRTDTVYRNIDKEDQVLQVRRIFALDYQIPDWIQKLLPKMQGYAMEDTTVDLKNKKLTAVGRNLSFSKICQSREVITYEQDPNDPSKTIYTQRMSYSINGIGAVLGRKAERAATDFSAKKAQAGDAVMTKRIDSLAATDWRNDTTTWRQNIVGMLNLAVSHGRLTASQASDQLRAAQARLMRAAGDPMVARLGRNAQFEKAADLYGYLASLDICSPEDNDECQIHYELGDLASAQSLLKSFDFLPDDGEKLILEGAILCRQGKYQEARKKCYIPAMNSNSGFSPGLAYNIAYTYYQEKMYEEALNHVTEIIERGVRDHPELGVGSNSQVVASNPTDGASDGVRSVGNSNILRDSALIEALNLKFALELADDNLEGAKECLVDMPPRLESELDPVTLHNVAIAYMDEKPSEGFAKLSFLLQSGSVTTEDGPLGSVPKEAFTNLLREYCKHGYYDLAADILAENPALTYSCLDEDEYEFFNCLILSQASPEEGFKQFDELAQKYISKLRKVTKEVQEGRRNRENAQIKRALSEFEEVLSQYIPVLMAQAKIFWDMDDYTMVEKLFRQSAEFCSEDETWKLNVAHVFFMQEKYNECIRYYEPFVRRHFPDNVLEVTAIILANLCVAYVMTGANDEAEEIMRAVEKAEEKAIAEAENDPTSSTSRIFHLCIINLVIGTLYCAKGNFEFGINRVMKSLDPMDRKLGMDTWYYAKRCFMALAENMAKLIVVIRDDTYRAIIHFLDQAAKHGTKIETSVSPIDMSSIVEAQTIAARAAADAAGYAVGESSSENLDGNVQGSLAVAAAAHSAGAAAAMAAAAHTASGTRTVTYDWMRYEVLTGFF